jgi:3-polyprenyl-4-hydroxybenzoate decarboxylase
LDNTSVPTGRDRLCANTDPQRDSIFTKGPSDALDHATSEIAMGSKLGIDATKKLAGEGIQKAVAAVNLNERRCPPKS